MCIYIYVYIHNLPRSCARTCNLQAVSTLINAYAKFGFAGEAAPEEQRRSSFGASITDSVFDCLLGELGRFQAACLIRPHLFSTALLV